MRQQIAGNARQGASKRALPSLLRRAQNDESPAEVELLKSFKIIIYFVIVPGLKLCNLLAPGQQPFCCGARRGG